VCQRTLRQRRYRYSSGRIYKPALALDGLAVEPRYQPVGDHAGRERAKIGGRHIAHGMPAVGVDDKLARRGHRAHHALGECQRAEFVSFAGHDQKGAADFFGMALPGQRFHKRLFDLKFEQAFSKSKERRRATGVNRFAKGSVPPPTIGAHRALILKFD
jgi:hypothetical protein